MNSNELVEHLSPYIGRKLRIWSQLTGAGLTWRPGHYPTLLRVLPSDVAPATHTSVWCEFDDGVGVQVDDDQLTIELAPAMGTYDFAEGRDQMEAVATAIRRYGPTAKELRNRCNCVICQSSHQIQDEVVQESFKDAWNHGPTDPELNLEGW